ncbi:ubiquinone biosynthesis protein coq-4 [Moelleriella libera RCEF 2490]|uniref:4-hydroxy-3-methoxy-5-polyprenylbenzoate decarboxylase n=1 Tax=Moelleriella libera RCEF 2490 TaxID=1081109 RepID=A0A162I9T5_9HYPO|nr:ubiquinone biosynthesis protein coq-4 [Moelleriella libera RCEF 2490]
MDAALQRTQAASSARRIVARGSALCAKCASGSSRPFSVLNRPPPKYPGHVPLTKTERLSMAIGSSVMALFNPPHRHGGRVNGHALLHLPPSRHHARGPDGAAHPAAATAPQLQDAGPRAWLDREGVSPDTRAPTRYVDDEECAYVMQRYRECHDFYHAITGLPIVREGEVALKAFEWANTLLPMPGLSMLAAATMKAPERARFRSIYLPWALRNGARCRDVINVFWEEQLGRDVAELRAELGIEQPPDLRTIRRRERQQNRRLEEIKAKGM